MNIVVSRGSSVSIVSDYGLDDWAIEVRYPAEEKGFFLYPLCPEKLWGPPSLLSNRHRGPFPGVKRGRDMTLTTRSHLVQRSGMSRSLTSSPPSAFMTCSGTVLFYVNMVMNETSGKRWGISWLVEILAS
jgi:hypothetical protein